MEVTSDGHGRGGFSICGAFRAAKLVQVGAAELPQGQGELRILKSESFSAWQGLLLASVQSLCAPGTERGEKGNLRSGTGMREETPQVRPAGAGLKRGVVQARLTLPSPG